MNNNKKLSYSDKKMASFNLVESDYNENVLIQVDADGNERIMMMNTNGEL